MNALQLRSQSIKHLGATIRFLQKAQAPHTWINPLKAVEKFTLDWDTSAAQEGDRAKEEQYLNACTHLNDFLTGHHYNSGKTFHVGHEDPFPKHPTIHVGVEDEQMAQELKAFLPGGCLWKGFTVEVKVFGRCEIDTTILAKQDGVS